MPERDEEAFKAWMKLLDETLGETLGVFVEDIPDMPYADWFNEELDVDDAVNLIKEELEYGE